VRQNRRLRNRAGYSFIEMLTVIVVMAILMTITIMSMAPQIQHGKVNNAASVVVGDLQYAQSLAVRYRQPIRVVVQSATRQYVIQERPPSPTVYRIRNLGEDSQFSLDSLGTTQILEFYPNGVALNTAELTVGLEGYERQVRVTRGGQIRIVRN